MGRKKLTKKRRITSITLNEELYNILVSQQENVSRYIENLIVTDINSKK